MKRALINIDYTVDFVADDGALTAGEPGQAIYQEILDLTKSFVEAGDYVVFAIDTHQLNDPYHPETQLFPPHNIEGTPGHELYQDLETYYQEVKDAKNVYYMEKTRYSAFAGTDLEIKLRERGIEELYLVGVCTDICVLHTAVDAYNKGFKIVIPTNCVATFTEFGDQWALDHFKNSLGAKLI
ncbi:cysteine hydrolase family protein [Hutsoniella sourekii]